MFAPLTRVPFSSRHVCLSCLYAASRQLDLVSWSQTRASSSLTTETHTSSSRASNETVTNIPFKKNSNTKGPDTNHESGIPASTTPVPKSKDPRPKVRPRQKRARDSVQPQIAIPRRVHSRKKVSDKDRNGDEGLETPDNSSAADHTELQSESGKPKIGSKNAGAKKGRAKTAGSSHLSGASTTKKDKAGDGTSSPSLDPRKRKKGSVAVLAPANDNEIRDVEPLSTVTNDLVKKLKDFATEKGTRMTKGVLKMLIQKKAFTENGLKLALGQIRKRLVMPSYLAIEDVIESASHGGPVFPTPIAESGTSIKEALKKGSNMKKGSNTKKGLTSGSTSEQKALKTNRGMTADGIQSIDATTLELKPLNKPYNPVPRLSYGLERVLFNPGVYQLQDPHSRVFNFDPYLQSIMPVHEFDFNALKEYVTSSKDRTLAHIAFEEKKKYSGSTSSMTSALSHFHYLLSQWRPINPANLSQRFPSALQSFTALQRSPTAIFLRWKDGAYAIDADKEFDSANILMMLGKSMEKLLTLPTEEYEKYRRSSSDQIAEEEREREEAYHYTTIGDFLLRSQLDAHDPRLPGTGMFDLKTRAVVSIRMDTQNYEQGLGYEIKGRHGEWESYEREYYDMIRAAFLKYSLQVRMGRMDGIFVAFHNIERIFGFQYISLPEMDLALHGTEDTTLGDSEFKISLELLNRVLDRATSKFPEQSLRIHFETRTGQLPFMYIFAEPVSEDEIEAIQVSNKASVEDFERKILGLEKSETSETVQNMQREAEWEALRAEVEQSLENDELGVEQDGFAGEVDTSLDGQDGEDKESDRILSAISSDDGEVNVVDEQLVDDEDENDGNEEEDGVETEEEDNEEHEEEEEEEEGEEEEEEEEEDQDQSANVRSETFTTEIRQDEAQRIDAVDETDGNGNHQFPMSAETAEDTGSAPPTTEDDGLEEVGDSVDSPPKESKLLGMVLSIRNKVNGDYVERPENLDGNDKWVVEYALAEIVKPGTAQKVYEATRARRAKALKSQADEEKGKISFVRNGYGKNLHRMSEEGREWRKQQNAMNQTEGVKVLGS